ncbi:hypothetical protein JTB14_009119 [Gonioctena quinquepunctata]|nr:hypothetical protein JTB14_009119 [Gonioctena quinquepunctata]
MDQAVETPLICRACLKIVECKAQSFGYIEDANGNLRDMLMCCVPEMDIYISTDPIICFPCIQVLITVYNFKSRCINTESIIRSYVQRNNLTEYNHVNLSCVVQDLIRINHYYKEKEERRIMAMKAELAEQERQIGLNEIHQFNTSIANNIPPHFLSQLVMNDKPPYLEMTPKANNIPPHPLSPLAIDDRPPNLDLQPHVNNVLPHFLTPPVINDKPPNVYNDTDLNNPPKHTSPFAVPQSAPQYLHSPSMHRSIPVSIPSSLMGPIPPTRVFSIPANSKNTLLLLAPSPSNKPPQRIPNENVPPLYFPNQSSASIPLSVGDTEIQFKEAQSSKLEISREDSIVNIANSEIEHSEKPFVHPIESKKRLVVRIPRSKITLPLENNEGDSEDSNEEDVDMLENHGDILENDVEMSENHYTNPLYLPEDLNMNKDPKIPVEKSINKIYNCTCMYLTTSEALFNEHKKICKDATKKLVRCPHCPHVTNRPYALSKHINTMHTKAVWFLCEYCTYRSTDRSCLRRHMRKNHEGLPGKESTCKICGYVCSTEYNLSKHMTKHEISTTLACDFCSYISRDRSNFRKHIFTHNTKMLECEYCDYRNVSPYQMRYHLKKYHDGVGIEDIDCKSDRPISEVINDIKAAIEEVQEGADTHDAE